MKKIIIQTKKTQLVQSCSAKKVSEETYNPQIFENRIVMELLTAEQLAARLNIAVKTVRKWRFEGYLPAETMIKLRSQVRYKWEMVSEWLIRKESI